MAIKSGHSMSALPREMAGYLSTDAMRPKGAASSSFDYFNVDEKERDAMTWSTTGGPVLCLTGGLMLDLV